jgi:hypothetical protein
MGIIAIACYKPKPHRVREPPRLVERHIILLIYACTGNHSYPCYMELSKTIKRTVG